MLPLSLDILANLVTQKPGIVPKETREDLVEQLDARFATKDLFDYLVTINFRSSIAFKSNVLKYLWTTLGYELKAGEWRMAMLADGTIASCYATGKTLAHSGAS